MKKKLMLMYIFALGFLFCATEVPAAIGPRAYPLHQPWDFREIKKGKTKDKVFFIKNIGDENLVIKNVHSCCGYNIIDVSSWEIKPDERIKIVISVDTERKNEGIDEKEITISSNDNKNPVLKIPVTSFIISVSKRSGLAVM